MQFCIKVVLLNRSYSTNTKPDIESLNKMGKEMIHELKGKETNKETVDGTLNLQMVHVRFTTALIRLRKVNADILGWIGCFQIVAKCRFMQQRQPRKLSTKKRRFFSHCCSERGHLKLRRKSLLKVSFYCLFF